MCRFEDIYPLVTHPVVTVHPVTGDKSIFVNPQFTLYIKGMAEDESRMILEMLYRKMLIHEYQYRHHWRPNMLVFWDNRNVQHSALHDYYPQRRLMERVTIAGTQPIPEGPAADHRNCAATSCRAKSKPGSINFGSGGNGTGAQLALEMFKSRAKAD